MNNSLYIYYYSFIQMNPLKQLLESKETVILDSAMGTEIQRRGYKTYLPLWTAPANEEVPDLVMKIHKENIQAGADIITTNTFRTIRWTYSKIGEIEKAEHLTKKAVEIAQNATKSSSSTVGTGTGRPPHIETAVS